MTAAYSIAAVPTLDSGLPERRASIVRRRALALAIVGVAAGFAGTANAHDAKTG